MKRQHVIALLIASTAVTHGPRAVGQEAVTQGLVAWWKFDETAAPIAKDSSGNGFDATIDSALSFASGKIGNALSSNGIAPGARLSYAAGSRLDFTSSSRVSILFWMKVAALPADVRLIGAPDTGGALVDMGSQGYLNLVTFSGSSRTGWPSVVSPDNAWHHYAITVDGTNASLFRDGALVGGNPFAPAWTSTQNKTFFIGGDGGRSLTGQLDDVRIYDRALTANEIETIYNTAK